MTSKDIYAIGYAIPQYGMYSTPWLFEGKIIATLPLYAIPRVTIDGFPARVAHVEEIRHFCRTNR